MKIYLLRHLQTTDNKKGINASRTDSPLSKEGVKESKKLINILSQNKYDIFIVSPLQRTRKTIDPFLKTLKNPKVVVDELVIERDLGALTNTRRGDGKVAEHRKQYGTDKIKWTPPNGESLLDVHERARKFYLKIIKEYKGQDILVCAHDIFLRSLTFVILNKPIEEFYTDSLPFMTNGELRVYKID